MGYTHKKKSLLLTIQTRTWSESLLIVVAWSQGEGLFSR